MKGEEGARRGCHARHTRAVEEGIVAGAAWRCSARVRARRAPSSTRDSGRASTSCGGRSRNRCAGSPATAGQDGAVVLEKVREAKDAFGFNAATEEYEDLIKAGIIDRPRWCGRRSQNRRRSRGSSSPSRRWWRRSRRTRSWPRPRRSARRRGLLKEWCFAGPPLPAAGNGLPILQESELVQRARTA